MNPLIIAIAFVILLLIIVASLSEYSHSNCGICGKRSVKFDVVYDKFGFPHGVCEDCYISGLKPS